MKTFGEYLLENINQNIIDHSIRANINENGIVTFYIHASNSDSDTLDFEVIGNHLYHLPKDRENIREAVKEIFEDISDRQGIGNELNQIGQETLKEIADAWCDIIELWIDK